MFPFTISQSTTINHDVEEYNEIRKKLSAPKGKGILQLCGCVESQRVHLMQGLGEDFKRKLIITYDELRARALYEDMKFFKEPVALYPAKDFIFFNADIKSNLLVKERMKALKMLLEEESATLITTIDGLMDSLIPLEELEQYIFQIEEGAILERDALIKKLFSMGYEKTHQVETPGQFSVRGGIVDIFDLFQFDKR